ncbi:MAG: YwmB family TATA-box binding protein [Sporolactobacillus sp.]
MKQMKQKYRILIMIGLVLLMSGSGAEGKETPSHQKVTDPLERVQQFSQAAVQNQAKVLGWSVYARKENSTQISKRLWTEMVANEKKKYADYAWRPLKGQENALGWQGTKRLSTGVKVKLMVFAYPSSENQFQTATSYEADGKSFKQSLWSGQKKLIRQNLDEIFQGQEQIFSCVKALDGVKMKSGLIEQGERYLKLFSAAPIERLNEKTFVSISAYTKTWNDDIISGKRKMNLQVALRRDDGRTVVTMGTPIITQEY